MTRTDLLEFTWKLKAGVTQVYELKQGMAEVDIALDTAVAADQNKAVDELASRKRQLAKQTDAAIQATGKHARVRQFEDAEQLLGQLSARIEQLMQLEKQEYGMQAAHELAAKVGHYDGEEGAARRAEIERQLSTVRQEIDTQLALIGQALPKPTIVLV